MLRHLLEATPTALETCLPASWLVPVCEKVVSIRSLLHTMANDCAAIPCPDPKLDPGMLTRMFESGVFSLTVPKHFGGVGSSLRDFVLAMESVGAMGPAWAMTAVPHLCISVKAVASLCEAQKAGAILSGILDRQHLLAFAITEDNGSDVAAVKTRLTRAADGRLRLNGRKQWITNLARASHVVVVALCPDLHKAPGATILILLDLQQQGVSIGKPWHKLCANGSDTADLYFDDILIDDAQLLGRPGQGMSLFNDMVLSGRLGAAAATLGMVRQAMDVAPKFAQSQTMVAGLDAMLAAITLSAAMGDADHPEFSMVTALAKHFCSRQAQQFALEIEDACIQAGLPVPAAVSRAVQAMGLFRLLKGPGEIISLHALAMWAPRMGDMPATTWPLPIRIGLACVLQGFAQIAKSGGISANPVTSMLLCDLAGAWWLVFATVMAKSPTQATPLIPAHRHQRAKFWAWQQLVQAARQLEAHATPISPETIAHAYTSVRTLDLSHHILATGAPP